MIRKTAEFYRPFDKQANELYRHFPLMTFEGHFEKTIAEHSHAFFEIDLYTQGSGINFADEEKVSYDIGDLILGNPFDSHTLIPKSPNKTLGVKFELSVVREAQARTPEEEAPLLLAPFVARDSTFRQKAPLSEVEKKQAEQLIKHLHQEYTARLPWWQVQCATLLEALLLVFYRAYQREKKTNSPNVNPLAHQLLSYIHVHFSEELTLEVCCEKFKLTPAKLNRLLTDCTGQGFKQCLLKRRINEAKHLLSVSDSPITEVSLSSGFRDLSNFNRLFQKTTGTSPRDFRNHPV